MFTYQIAETAEEKAEALDFIQISYAQMHPGNDYKKSIAVTFFEEIAVDTILLRYEQQLVGTVSLLQNVNGGLLPSEYLFGLERSPLLATNPTEVGRLAKAINSGLPKEVENKIFPMLLWLTALRLTERKIDNFICSVQHYLARKFAQIGFKQMELDRSATKELPTAFGSYAKGNIKFLYCEVDTSYRALERLALGQYLTEHTTPVSMINIANLIAA